MIGKTVDSLAVGTAVDLSADDMAIGSAVDSSLLVWLFVLLFIRRLMVGMAIGPAVDSLAVGRLLIRLWMLAPLRHWRRQKVVV